MRWLFLVLLVAVFGYTGKLHTAAPPVEKKIGQDSGNTYSPVTQYGSSRFMHSCAVAALAISPSGNEIATLSEGQIQVWNSRTGDKIKVFGGRPGLYHTLLFTPDGALIGAGGFGSLGIVSSWDSGSWRLRWEHTTQKGSYTSLAYSHKVKLLAIGSRDRFVYTMEATSGKLLHRWSSHKVSGQPSTTIHAVAFTESGLLATTGSGDWKVKLWTLAGTLMQEYNTDSEVNNLTFHPDGALLAYTTSKGLFFIDLLYAFTRNERSPKSTKNGEGGAMTRASEQAAHYK